MHPVKAAIPDVSAMLALLRTTAQAAKFRVHEFGSIDGLPLLALTKRTPGPRPRIYLSGASHGDEPAGPAALLKLMQHGFFDTRATWFICPVLNPIGLMRGTRENGAGIDLNRDYRATRSYEVKAHLQWLQSQPPFDLALCLHEDWESAGFYLYELNPARRPSLAEPMVRAVSEVCPIELAELIDGRPGRDGIIRPIDKPELRDPWPEAIYLCAEHTDLCYTTESPSARPIEVRVAAQCLAVETAVAHVCSHVPSAQTSGT